MMQLASVWLILRAISQNALFSIRAHYRWTNVELSLHSPTLKKKKRGLLWQEPQQPGTFPYLLEASWARVLRQNCQRFNVAWKNKGKKYSFFQVLQALTNRSGRESAPDGLQEIRAVVKSLMCFQIFPRVLLLGTFSPTDLAFWCFRRGSRSAAGELRQ